MQNLITNYKQKIDMEKLNKLIKVFMTETQHLLKNNNTNGICYLLAHSLNEYLIELGYKSEKVTGKLALLKKGKKAKYLSYGNFSLKNYDTIGYYHSWCKIEINNTEYVIDTSLIYNKSYLKKNKISLSSNIPDFVITTKPKNYNYKYIEDNSLSHLSELNLAKVSPMQILEMITTPLCKAKETLQTQIDIV
jgi:hypothetical protein